METIRQRQTRHGGTERAARAACTSRSRHRAVWGCLTVGAVGGALALGPLTSISGLASAATSYQSVDASPGAQDLQAATATDPVVVGGDGSFQTVLTLDLRNDAKKPALAVISAAMTASNLSAGDQPGAAPQPATLRMRALVDNKPQWGEYATTISPGAVGTLAGFLNCNGLPPGNHTVELQAAADGSPLTIAMRAADGFRPIVIPPARSRRGGRT